LAFVRRRASHSDVYRCTATTPCEGRALHHRGDRGTCGVSAEAASGYLLFWTECPGQESTAIGAVTVESLTTGQVAERLQVPVNMVVHLLASGKLSSTKVNHRWGVPAAALKEYIVAAPARRRDELKAKYSEKSVVATASQASKGSAGKAPTDIRGYRAIKGYLPPH
jgi:excisionase family DNA binding protein